MNKQKGHIHGTKEHANRVKQGNPTSTFADVDKALTYTTIAWQRGTPVKGNPDVRDYEFGKPIGFAPKGGTQSKVRVHRAPSTNTIHGHPAGPVTPQ